MNKTIFLYDLSIKYEINKLNPLSVTGLQFAKCLSTQKNLYGLRLQPFSQIAASSVQPILRHYTKSAGELPL